MCERSGQKREKDTGAEPVIALDDGASMESPEPLILHCIQRSWFLYRLLSLCGGALGVNKNDEDLHASEAGSATISWLIK